MFLVKAAAIAKQKILYKWMNGPADLTQADFGDPMNGSTRHSLCIYDEVGGVPHPAIGLAVEPAGLCSGVPCWKPLDGKGWSYKNGAGNGDGVTKLRETGGPAGQPRVELVAKGAEVPLPAPAGVLRFFAQDPRVVAQLHVSDPANCWTSTFTGAARNESTVFKSSAL